MNTQYCISHKSIPYKLVFGQLPHCDTNLANILENKELLNNHVLESEDFQSTIVSEIDSKTTESELDEIYFEKLQEIESEFNKIYFKKLQEIEQMQDNTNEIQDDADKLQYNNDYDKQEFYNKSLYNFEIKEFYNESLYNSEIEECSKNILVSKIIKIVDSNNDSSENQHYF
ncbi:9015_t:CDS:2 [Cetraspora pellucida]|uniref:9015_t:CDS:1 n=1 Tax=Cetraspora pellucida TaxID=1433469 RepID=A0ACA9LRR3_9GLOM|nr:9015_t:CDS:2 [Cetraspora pellucida]